MPSSYVRIDPRFAQPGHHAPATIDKFDGVRFLHLGTSWMQGARLSKPDAIKLEYEMNAPDFVHDVDNHGQVDVLQVDMYDHDARGPVLDSPDFYQGCYDCLSSDGIMTANVFGDLNSYDKNLLTMQQVFDAVVWLPRGARCQHRSPRLQECAAARLRAAVRARGLPAKKWVDGLKEWMRGHA